VSWPPFLSFLPRFLKVVRRVGGVVDDLIAVDEVEELVRERQRFTSAWTRLTAGEVGLGACVGEGVPGGVDAEHLVVAFSAKFAASRPAPVPASRMSFLSCEEGGGARRSS
jgi:hypothetical protein